MMIPLDVVVDDHMIGTMTNWAEISADDGSAL